MSFDFKRVVVSEVCELIVDCVNKTAPKVDYATPYKMIRTPNIRNGVINLDGCNFVTEDTYRKWTRRAIVRRDDVLLTREAPMGEVGIVDFEDEVFLGQRIMQYRADQNKVCPKFLFYSFLSSDLRNQFYQHEGSGSVVSHIRVPDCLKFEINLPSLETQKRITSVLWSLDQKIKNNSEINQTLEQMAQALFKSWFVDFEPVKAKIAVLEAGGSQKEATLAAMTAISGKDVESLEIFKREQSEKYAELKATAELFPSAMQESELGGIPNDWSIGKLGDIIDFNPKRILKKGNTASYLDMRNVPVVGHSAQDIIDREFSSGSKFKNGDTLLARITPCLENGKTAYVDFLPTDEVVGWGSTEFIVMRSNKNLPLSLSYFFARLDSFRNIAIQSMQGTSGRQRADASVLENHVWIVPSKELLQKFGTFSDSILAGNRSRYAENKHLAQLRDTLLPKLLSGEITLPETEQAVSKAENV
ncbi:restriction endonuclease subunit S [Serratia liquefaciens]|uniref:restriction endonuclease subunit S n=1 Tax=Serratia liquefaciens TaxID=614 RepID=UPI002183E469|nr:restriction endonuclease subunit S [Serratia liquefaciens]CAI2539969.1 EcoKI restriction-modification system protein HsdS [Serratia liquefaciens]